MTKHTVDPDIRPLFCEIYEATRQYWDLGYGQGPSKDELSRACQCSITSVIAAIKALRLKGYLVAPKHGIRAVKPTDMERTISTTPPVIDPWAELTDEAPETKQYWNRR